MKILVICQYYYPEPFRINDLCEELVRMGNEVTVVTGTPNYPMGEIYPGYEDGKKANEIINGVNVHRCKISPRKKGLINRVKNYFCYPIASSKYVKKLDGSYDVVFIYQLSPVMMAEAGIRYKKKHNKRLVLYCLDLWPESLCIGGIKKDSLVYKLFKLISKRIYKSADKILITSRSFREYFENQFAIPEKKIDYLPQYAESMFLEAKTKKQGEIFNVLFAGNIGKAQNIEIIVDAARLLKDEKIIFRIVGDGVEYENIKKRAEGLENIVFYGRKPQDEMIEYFELADAAIVTLIDDPIVSGTLPGKVQAYMAAAKAVIGAAGGETSQVLNEVQGGFCGASGDAEALAENILTLMKSGRAENIGKANRDYYIENFLKENHMRNLSENLEG